MHRSRTKQRPPSPTVQNATDEKKNKKRKRKILKKKRKTKRPPRAVDDSARGQRPRKRRPKACEYVIVLHNRGHEPIAVQLHVCGALGISLECLAAFLHSHTLKYKFFPKQQECEALQHAGTRAGVDQIEDSPILGITGCLV